MVKTERTPNTSRLARALSRRELSYERAAEQIRNHHRTANDGDELALTGGYLGMLARGDVIPSRKLALAIAAWVGAPREVTAAGLLGLE